ncbi:BACON domain-containing carbohydrate-binding protein [Alistipes putredinis]|uniref:BACON domain-containing protein n=1 Tax=Alistipes putredinis TaxID=28117 RepID=UPI0032C10472
MGGGSCTDSNTDEEQAILIPQEALSATIAADSGLKHTVSFETTGEWWASVESPGSGDTWITLSPTSGSAGKNTITATLTENIQPTSRKAVITILCGTESAAVTITQQGTGTSEEPAKPEHPEISPENRLTYIEVSENKKTTTEDGTEESTTQGYIDLIYDAQGVLTNFNYYTFDRNQPDKLNGSSKTVLNWEANKFSLSQYNIEITSYSSIPRITKDDRSERYQLNKSGLISQYSYFDDNRDIFIYNPDGTLATKEFYLAGTALENLRSKYKWEAGDLTSITASASSYCFSYTYTQFLNPWNGIDIGSFAIAGVDDIGCLLGISGTTTKHLPASQQTKYKNSQYQYTFDNEGRVSTIVVTSTFHNPESMENISIATQTEYTLHYGTTPSPEPDYLAYLTDQKIIEEGTLGYIFDGDDPEGEHIVLPNAYTSYAKILNTLSDGTTKETTEYRQVKITLPEEHLGYIYVTQQDIDDFELISVTQEKEDDGKDITSPLTYTFTFEYNCFTEKFRLKIEPPYCNLYSEQTGTWNLHPMPTLPLDDDCIVCYPPEVTQLNDNPIQIDYKFVQKYVIKINPEAEITDQNVSQIDRLLYVRQ